MIFLDRDLKRMQYTIRIDYEDIINSTKNQDAYNKLICRISKLIYEEMRKRL